MTARRRGLSESEEKMDGESLEARHDVWHILSDLYLDTELDKSNYAFIASELKKSRYSLQEVEVILFEEVHPVLCWNLMTVAGEWAGFDKALVVDAITSYLEEPIPKSWFKRQKKKAKINQVRESKNLIIKDWRGIKSSLSDGL